eukprot:TRINITY_DN10103_c0_g1_i2.p1 TRINITY_DN10103_c0_g1~~TRINITY_DN10103_c0_g1_i2.p1  ORF type:complete len:329 (-),score=29.98 TRINITY_DN10103_c0_g1_i2:171-1043(-)
MNSYDNGKGIKWSDLQFKGSRNQLGRVNRLCRSTSRPRASRNWNSAVSYKNPMTKQTNRNSTLNSTNTRIKQRHKSSHHHDLSKVKSKDDISLESSYKVKTIPSFIIQHKRDKQILIPRNGTNKLAAISSPCTESEKAEIRHTISFTKASKNTPMDVVLPRKLISRGSFVCTANKHANPLIVRPKGEDMNCQEMQMELTLSTLFTENNAMKDRRLPRNCEKWKEMSNIRDKLRRYAERISQIEGEKRTQEKENEQLRKDLCELQEREKTMAYFNKIQIEGPPLVSLRLKR